MTYIWDIIECMNQPTDMNTNYAMTAIRHPAVKVIAGSGTGRELVDTVGRLAQHVAPQASSLVLF